MRPIIRALGLGVGIGLMLIVAGLGALLVVAPKAAGATPLTVLTSSMDPVLPVGTLVVVRPAAPSTLRVGQVATYQIASGRPEVVTHRIVAVTSGSDGDRVFTFRGDANRADDEPVHAVQIRGVVWYSVPLIGWANEAVNGRQRAWVVPAVAGILFAYSGATIALGIVSRVRRRSAVHGRRRSNYRRRGHVHSYE